MIEKAKPVSTYRWSSGGCYLKRGQMRPEWLRTDRLLGEHGLKAEGARDRREFGRRMEAMRQDANSAEEAKSIRRGWKLGGEDFLDWILEKVEVKSADAHSRRERDETEQGRAARIVRDELKKLGWTKTDLKRRRKGDPKKVALARLLREKTAVSLKWIAANLEKGRLDPCFESALS